MDPESPRHPGRQRGTRHVLPGRLDGLALPGRGAPDGRRRKRGGRPHLHPCRSLVPERGPRHSGDRTDTAGAGGSRGHHDDTLPRPVLVDERRDRQLQLARLQEARRDGLHQCLHRHGQRGLAAAGRLQDHQVGHTEERKGRLGAFPRRGRQPRPDPRSAASVHQEDEVEGLYLHHGQRRPATNTGTAGTRAAGAGTADAGCRRALPAPRATPCRATRSRPRTARPTPPRSGRAAPSSVRSPSRSGPCPVWPRSWRSWA